MSISIQDEATIATLSPLSSSEDVLTSDGRLLGRFIPVSLCKVTYPELRMTDEEIEREDADLSGTWYTPDEVMARLHSLMKRDTGSSSSSTESIGDTE